MGFSTGENPLPSAGRRGRSEAISPPIELYSEVGAIIETSFDQGVLALYLKDDVLFFATDAEWVEELGEVMSGLFYRLDDLRHLQEKEAQLRQIQQMFLQPLMVKNIHIQD